ncbi:MAG: ankyrin repeat domain-containing protein, partial [Pseudomonadota bacterium]|nr:ankyrin repeat domain-containing protein [Pseudomonadota bacterium]
PHFRYDGSDSCKAIACKAITGGHLDFYQNLVMHYGFPDYQDPSIARALVLPAITSGKLAVVELLTAKLHGQLLTTDHLLEAVRLGHTSIYKFLIDSTLLPPDIYNASMVEEILSHACLFDNLELVKYFLEDKTAQEKWHFTPETLQLTESLRDRALQGGSKKVLKYLHDKDPNLLVPKELFEEFPALFVAANNKQLNMCRHLINKYKLDPLFRTDEDESCIHAAAAGGDYDCFLWLADIPFSKDELPINSNGETPLHYAARAGNYWFIRQAYEQFDVNEFLRKSTAGTTLLQYALQSNNEHLIEFLKPIDKHQTSHTTSNLTI